MESKDYERHSETIIIPPAHVTVGNIILSLKKTGSGNCWIGVPEMASYAKWNRKRQLVEKTTITGNLGLGPTNGKAQIREKYIYI
jgi:hypothetical protein